MNATKRSAARAGLVVCSILAVALTGCRTQVVHEHPRTVYLPAPLPPAPGAVAGPPAPAPQAPPPVVVVTPPEPTPVVVIQSENDFYEPLAAHGRWVVVGSYGRCWIPAPVEAGWRPYSNGYWQRTDAGWYWASEEPWGWATYHYGRWDFHAQFGWFWVPQTQWAPAWVAWREGGGYVGWAPLGPSVTIGVNLGRVDYEPAFASRAFVFVEHRRMLEPVRPRTVIVNNTTIINQTVNITNVKIVNRTVINEGPRPEVIERESGRKVYAIPAREFRHREEATVAARERNIPPPTGRKSRSLARTEPQPVEKKAVLPPATRQVERPAQVMNQSRQPLATPVRPTPPRPELTRPAREENKRAGESAKQIATTPPTIEPRMKPELKPAPAVSPRPELRSVVKPAVDTKPTTQPVRPRPIRDEEKPEVAIERKNPATPPAIEPKPRQEVRPERRPATKPPVKLETAPPPFVGKQIPPTTEKSADKELVSPKHKSRAAEQAEANKKQHGDKGPKKQGEDQETPPPVVPARPSR